MTKICSFCKKARPVLRAESLHNPYTECLNCGATMSLPEMRYRVDWNTKKSETDGRPWFEFFADRQVAIECAKKHLKIDLDRAVVTDRWEIARPLVFIKKDEVQV